MALWIYKCNTRPTNGSHSGNWIECFAAMRRSPDLLARNWGGTKVTSHGAAKELARSARVGQRLLCWQNWDAHSRPHTVARSDRSAACGIVEIAAIHTERSGETRWDLRLVEEFDPPVPLLRWRAVDPIIGEPFVMGHRMQSYSQLSKRAERAILAACGSTLATADQRVSDRQRRRAASGAGFGVPESNRFIESAASSLVERTLEREGWNVEDVASAKMGFDLVARRGNRVRHIEVKGTSGSKLDVIITENEVRKSRSDRSWELWVVTEAGSRRAKTHRFTHRQFRDRFDLTAISYRATTRIR